MTSEADPRSGERSDPVAADSRPPTANEPRTPSARAFVDTVRAAVLDPAIAKMIGAQGEVVLALVSPDAIRDALIEAEAEARSLSDSEPLRSALETLHYDAQRGRSGHSIEHCTPEHCFVSRALAAQSQPALPSEPPIAEAFGVIRRALRLDPAEPERERASDPLDVAWREVADAVVDRPYPGTDINGGWCIQLFGYPPTSIGGTPETRYHAMATPAIDSHHRNTVKAAGPTPTSALQALLTALSSQSPDADATALTGDGLNDE